MTTVVWSLNSCGADSFAMQCISYDGTLREFPLRGENGRMKLLIVDHDRYLVEMLTSWLKTLGFDVHRAYTGEGGKSEWEEAQPYLVIIDKKLKDVDASAMCRQMQQKYDALILVTTEGKHVQAEI